MTQDADQGRSRREKHSTYIDRDVLAWLKRRGERLDRTVDYQIREILRAAMESDQGDYEDTVQ